MGMTRKEAIERLNNAKGCPILYDSHREAINMAIQALSQEPCDDAVSRADVIELIERGVGNKSVTIDGFTFGKSLMLYHVKQLPSVTQKSGKWIAVYQGDEIINYRCSECELGDTNGSTNLYGWDYCRRCGARMVEPQESEGKE